MSIKRPDHFTSWNKIIDYVGGVVEMFNKFFVDASQNLAEDIRTTGGTINEEELEGRKIDLMTLDKIEKRDIIDNVAKYENKTSAYWEDIDMYLVKKVTEGIVGYL